MKNHWKTLVIFILAIALTSVISRGYESRYIENLLERNFQLEQLKLRTEQVINQSANLNVKLSFRQLGYNIVISLPDTTEESK